MTKIDGYLSNLAQRINKSALVVCNAEGTSSETWLLVQKGEDDIGLGESFKRATQAIHAWIKSKKTTTL